MRNCHSEEREVSVSGEQVVLKGLTLSENCQSHDNVKIMLLKSLGSFTVKGIVDSVTSTMFTKK